RCNTRLAQKGATLAGAGTAPERSRARLPRGAGHTSAGGLSRRQSGKETKPAMEQLKRILNARNLLVVTSLYFLVQLLIYFFTGAGGPMRLATRLVPVALILYILKAYKDNELYPRLGTVANRIIATIYVIAALIPLVYL